MPIHRRCAVTRLKSAVIGWILAGSLAGCATTVPYAGQGPHPQITRGRPVPPLDALGNVLGVLSKVLLWNWKVDRHSISEETEQYLVQYIDAPSTMVHDTQFSLNEYNPIRDLKRLVHNHKVAWPYRLLLGVPTTLVFDVLLPGRLVGGDRYNPFTDTVQLYSDVPPIALHEAGHAHDVNTKRFKGTYAAIRLIPLIDLYQEYQASDHAIDYCMQTFDHEQEWAAYKILYPAFGTYVGSYIFPPIGTVAGAAAGHVIGRSKAWQQGREFRRLEQTYPEYYRRFYGARK
ncbi:MAG: hypothetical protein HYY59_00200 [Candidatus Omnitrophica bacterium]|nr:hypothetical protein [Candidatus Omnitrophota bacterium]